ncbi:MAG: hypothetical protein ACK43N_21645, partial [Pirellulaceae bacterium]
MNGANIVAGAGAVAISVGLSGQGTAAAVSIGGSFAINHIDGDNEGNLVWAEVDESQIVAKRRGCAGERPLGDLCDRWEFVVVAGQEWVEQFTSDL